MLVYWSIFIYTTIVSIIVKSNSNKTEYFKSGLSENIIAAKRVGIFGAFITFFLLVYFLTRSRNSLLTMKSSRSVKKTPFASENTGTDPFSKRSLKEYS